VWLAEIEAVLPTSMRIFGSNRTVAVERAFNFLTLTDEARSNIDIGLAGPHSVFLPCGDMY
jgi:hypothetical protein